MAIKNQRVGGTDFNTPDDRVRPTDLNDTFDRFANALVESTVTFLEGINFNTELAQNNSITDKSYNYAFSDYFSDSDGYNDSIDSSNTTANYYSSNNLYSDSINWNALEYTGNNTQDVTGSDTRGIYFKPDGAKIYYVDNGSTPKIYQDDLSTPWDITTNSNQNSINTQSSDPIDVFLKSDGTKLFENDTNGVIYEWDLSSPWDLSTATYNSSNFTSSNSSNLQSIFFKDDGSLYFEIDSTFNIYQYELSTNWDLSTRTLKSSLNISHFPVRFSSFTINSMKSLYISNDGKKLIVGVGLQVGVFNYKVGKIYLSKAWEIDSAKPPIFEIIDFSNSGLSHVFAKDDGEKIYFTNNSTGQIHSYINTASSTGEIVQTNPISRGQNPTSIVVTTYFPSSENIKLDISSDGGNNFELTDVNPNEIHNLDGDDNRIVIKFKLVQNGNPYYLSGFAFQVWEN